MKILAFPFAGGSKYSFNFLKEYFNNNRIDFETFELPGRGKRMGEPLCMDIESVVDDVFRQIRFNVTSPYALFGHSFGGLISYLLLEKLKSNNCPLPLHLFVSGRGAPSQPLWDIPYHTLSKKDLIWKLKELDGSPAEVLENAELFDFFEPILRADFQAIETYRYHPTRPYDLPITIFVGKEEGREERDVLGWQIETIQRISIHEMDGKHFFIFDKGKEMVDIMTRCLRPVTASR